MENEFYQLKGQSIYKVLENVKVYKKNNKYFYDEEVVTGWDRDDHYIAHIEVYPTKAEIWKIILNKFDQAADSYIKTLKENRKSLVQAAKKDGWRK